MTFEEFLTSRKFHESWYSEFHDAEIGEGYNYLDRFVIERTNEGTYVAYAYNYGYEHIDLRLVEVWLFEQIKGEI